MGVQAYGGLVGSGQHYEGVVPVLPNHEEAGASRGTARHKQSLYPSDNQLPVPSINQLLGCTLVFYSVGAYDVRGARSSDEVTVLAGGDDADLVLRDVHPEERVCDFEVWGDRGESLQSIPKPHPEGGEHSRCLHSLGVWFFEELSWHLSVGLDHGAHGSLLGYITDRLNVHTTIVSLGGNRYEHSMV